MSWKGNAKKQQGHFTEVSKMYLSITLVWTQLANSVFTDSVE
jgi:hypothetical protein